MTQDSPIRVGEVVLCRRTHRVGTVEKVVEPDARGRRYYVRWQGLNPDFSLMGEHELHRRPDAGPDPREVELG